MGQEKEIWASETGILDLPENWQELRVAELVSVREAWKNERKRLEASNRLTQFTEQLSREWAIETGIIENLYEIERGVTKTLIEQGFQAATLEMGTTNKPREWVIQLLKDQQEALEGLFSFVKQERPLSTSYVKQLHDVILRHQTSTEGMDTFRNYVKVPLIRGDWKRLPNYPTRDDVTYRYCPPEQVASEMDRLIAMHIEHLTGEVPPEIESAWLHHRFSQIHPFQDGNGRVARTLASLVFIQQGLFPVVVTRDDKEDYIDALEAADAGNLKPLISLFAKLQRVRFRMAVSTSETTLRTGVSQALAGLKSSISKKIEAQKAQLNLVFAFAETLEQKTYERLEEIAPELKELLVQLEPSSFAVVGRSTKDTTDHYYRGQIIEIARDYLHYYANPTPYRSWVRLKIAWVRRASLVFTFHAIGQEFAGVLVCAPFLEFQDEEEDNEVDPNGGKHFDVKKTLVNVAREPFDFYYNESEATIVTRFEVWLEEVLTVSLAQLQSNL